MQTSNKRLSMATAVLVAAFAGLTAAPVAAQDLEQITFAQPSPSAINSYPVFVAIGEG